jgi:flagellin-like protein
MGVFRMRDPEAAVSAVVGTILLVAITVALAGVLYVTMSGVMVETPPKEPTLIMDAGTWSNGSVTVEFLGLTNADGLSPINLYYVIQAANGTIYFSGPEGNKTLVANITVNVTYRDTGNIGKVSPEDLMVITVTPAANATVVRESTFKVLTGQHVAGQTSLQ